jgi:RNase P/RNase MRP subunit p29
VEEKTFREVLEGRKVRILESSDKSRKGMQGTVIKETKNLLELETERGLKKIPKSEIMLLELDFGGKKIIVNGKEIRARVENRMK